MAVLVVTSACSAALNADGRAACRVGALPLDSVGDRVAFRAQVRTIEDANVKPNEVGQAYFKLRALALQANPDSDGARLVLPKLQAELAEACDEAGYDAG